MKKGVHFNGLPMEKIAFLAFGSESLGANNTNDIIYLSKIKYFILEQAEDTPFDFLF